MQSTAVLEDVSVAASADAASAEPKKRMPTRFDRLKQTYKGFRFQPPNDDETIAFSYEEFDKAVRGTEYAFERNSVVTGVAVEYTPNGGCLVDIGAKASAFLPEQEASLVPSGPGHDLSSSVPLDTPLQFQIISEEDENGQLLVSIKRLQYKQAWESVVALSEQDAIIEAPVVAVNRGGAICLVEGLRAFLPGSHLAGMLPDENLVGQVLKLKFLEVNSETNKLVVSNRKAVVEAQMADLSRGDLVTGVVKALKPYGAFVEVGGMSGLLHISQISYDRIDDLEQVLQPGMPVKCIIIDHDKVNGRIALATRMLEVQAGDMIRDPKSVFDNAEENAARYYAKQEEERKLREATARNIVSSLGDSFDALGGAEGGEGGDALDPLADVSDSLDSLLS